MKRRTPVYSRSTGAPSGSAAPAAAQRAGAAAPAAPAAAMPTATATATATAAAPARRRGGLRRLSQRYSAPLWLLTGGVLVLLILVANGLHGSGAQRKLTQRDIDKAVLHTLNTKLLPAPAAKAAEAIRPSVVMVRDVSGDGSKETENGVGTGVVITESGLILTNLHVVAHAQQLKVVFYDGSESEASIVNVQPEHDLAVIRARVVPDDTVAATLRSTEDLRPGDAVVAMGFPFGIGPTTSAGVVSGLKREFRSPKGERVLTNLIQFDAMANPGSSGGPLVTLDGAVVGIVTAILNPTDQRVFIGIGFAVPIENAASGVGLHPF
jgi:S1-C subfamily serine protease